MFSFSFSDKWSPALQIRTVLLSIQALMSAPNPDDPLANDVAEQWKSNEEKALKTGKVLRRIRAIDTYPTDLKKHTLDHTHGQMAWVIFRSQVKSQNTSIIVVRVHYIACC